MWRRERGKAGLLWLCGVLILCAGWARSESCADGLGAAGPLLPDPVADAESAQAVALLARGPVVQRVTESGATIMGRAVDGLLGQTLTVTVTPDGGGPRVQEGRYDSARDGFLVRFEDLPANTVCRYTVSTGGQEIGPFHFVTAPEDSKTPFRLAVYSDSQARPDTHAAVAAATLRASPRLLLHAGDITQNGREAWRWEDEFFGPARQLLAHVPVAVAYGNHDLDSRLVRRLLDLPGRRSYYTFRYGAVQVLVLDSNRSTDRWSRQYRWLRRELRKPKVGWRLAVFHHPVVGISERGSGMRALRDLAPRFERYKVDLVFNGHHHHYMRSKTIAWARKGHGVTYVVTGGAGGTLVDGQRRSFVAAYAKAHHYVEVDVWERRLELRAVGVDGRVLDGFVVSKDRRPTNYLRWKVMWNEGRRQAARGKVDWLFR